MHKAAKRHCNDSCFSSTSSSRKHGLVIVAATPTIVVIADDQIIDRKGLAALLEGQADFRVAGEAATSRETLDACRRFIPDVLILCTRLPDLDSIPLIHAVRTSSPRTHVLVIAERSEGRCHMLNPPTAPDAGDRDTRLHCGAGRDCVALAVSQGAIGAIRRSCTPEDLFSAVRAVAAGNAWCDVRVLSRLLDRVVGAQSLNGLGFLSTREREVAALIVDGHSNKEIAETLRISEPTVKKHVGHLLGKLHLHGRLNICRFFSRNPQYLERDPVQQG